MAFGTSPDGRLLLASGSDDRTVRLWDPAAETCIATLQRRSRVRSVEVAGLTLTIGDEEGIYVIELDAASTTTDIQAKHGGIGQETQ